MIFVETVNFLYVICIVSVNGNAHNYCQLGKSFPRSPVTVISQHISIVALKQDKRVSGLGNNIEQ